MSLLHPCDEPAPPPSLAGSELLVDPSRPEICCVKGIMFAPRHRFLKDQFGEVECTPTELRCTCRGDGVCLYDLRWS